MKVTARPPAMSPTASKENIFPGNFSPDPEKELYSLQPKTYTPPPMTAIGASTKKEEINMEIRLMVSPIGIPITFPIILAS